MKRLLVLLLFLAACSQVTISEEWPDGYPKTIVPEQPTIEEEVFPEPVIADTFSVIEGKPVLFVLGGERHTIELFEIIQERARMRVDDVSFMIGVNETANRSGVQLTILEAVNNSVPIPRQSVVDLTVGGVREKLVVGETITIGNVSAKVDFVGLKDGAPQVRIVVGEQSAILAEKDEQRFDEFWVYVHNIYFNDATEYDLADAVTVNVK